MTYYFRTVDRNALIQVGVDLGILRADGEQLTTIRPALAWDEVGHIQVPTGNMVETDMGPVPETTPLTDPNGVPYWHVNMQFEGDLMAHAQAEQQLALAAGETERAVRIEQHIADSPQYFVLDELGQPRKPNSPVRIFWT